MSAGGAVPAGSSRVLRLDPFALPVRFPANDSGADERVRIVELHRERVVMRRSVRGISMAVNVPVSAYRGVAIRLKPADGDFLGAIAVVLEHRDPALSLELFAAAEGDEIVAEWQSWGKVLGLPLLVAENGELREPFARIGQLRVAAPGPRRRRRNAIRARRPSILLRRKPGVAHPSDIVYRGEREIIARN